MTGALGGVATKQDAERLDAKRKRSNRVVIAVVALAIVGSYLFTGITTRNYVTESSAQRSLNSAIGALEKTNEQRTKVGLPALDVPKIAQQLESGQTTPSDVSALNTIAKLQTDPRLRTLPGLIGAAGADGTPCLSTDPNCVGAAGTPGAAGDPGAPGGAGEPGDPGKQGELGATGEPGAVGGLGPAGLNGAAGPAGPMGPMGLMGDQGPPGPIASPTNADFVGGAGNCNYVTDFDNGVQTSASVPDILCGGDSAGPPTTEDAPVTE